MTLSELEGFRQGSVAKLEQQLRTIGVETCAIVGVGNSLRADDFAGSFVAKKLNRKLARGVRQPLVLDAETAPENYCDKIRAYGPRKVIFVDSAVMGSPPGTIKLLDLEETDYPYFSTHNVPLRLIANVLGEVKRSYLLGIEPRSTEFGKKMSEEVRRSCAWLVRVICRIVAEREETQSV